VNVAPIVEMFDVSAVSTRAAALAQGSDPSPQAFHESLLAASKASSGAGAAYQAGTGTGRRQKPVSQDEKLPPSMPHGRAVPSPPPPQKTVQQQVLVPQQPLLINPALIPKQPRLGEPGPSASASTVTAGQPTRDVPAVTFLPIESKLAQPVVAKSDSVPSSYVQKEDASPQAASVSPAVVYVSQTATNLSNAIGNRVLNPISSTLPNAPNKNAIVFTSAVPDILPDAVQTSVPRAVSSAAPSAVPSVAPTALPSALLSAAKMADSSAIESLFPSPTPSVVSTAIQKPLPDATPSAVPTAPPGAFSTAVQNLTLPLVPSAIVDVSSSADPAPVLHDGVNPSARGAVGPKSSTVSTSQANPPAVTTDPSGLATDLIVPGATVDQLAALLQPGGGLLVDAQASASKVSPAGVAKPPSAIAVADAKDGAHNAGNDATGLKQHAQAASQVTSSQTGSQGTAQSGDQSQGDASQQGQGAVLAQVNFANHTIAAIDHAQNGGVAAPLQTAPTPSGVPGHTAKTADIAAPATIALPQPVPVINTAKLIQSMGQTEMRVGMRSNDFGNISISTSANRDLISAQISLDHGELARTLAAHLPEMQARLGGNQAMDVRIDMNGQATTGQGAGAQPGMSNGSPDGSRGERQQKGSATSSRSGDGFAAQGSSIAAAGLPSGEGRLDTRLDIRV